MNTDHTAVILTCDTNWDYALLLPVTCLLWRDLVGYEPRVFLIGDEAEWSRDACVRACLAALREHGIRHEFVAHLPGYRSPITALGVRTHVAADPSVPDDHWLMVGDADLWPTQRDPYRQHEGTDYLAFHYFANGDWFRGKDDALAGWDANIPFQSIPSYYFGMRAREWRALYRYGSTDMREAVLHTYDTLLQPRLAGKDRDEAGQIAWHFDQYYMTALVCRRDWFPGRVLLVNRENGSGRGHIAPWASGGGWDGGLDFGWLDAHMGQRGIYALRRWEPLLPLAGHLLPQHAEWVRDFFERATAEA